MKTLASVFLTSYPDLLSVLKKLCSLRLTKKQKAIIDQASLNEHNSTKLVKNLSSELKCSKSALWNNLRQLVQTGLITTERGKPCRLTRAGIIIKGGEKNE